MRTLKLYKEDDEFVVETINEFNHSWKHRYVTVKGLFDHLDSCAFAIRDWDIEASKELFASVVKHLSAGDTNLKMGDLEMNQDFSVDGYLPCGTCGVWIDDGSYSNGSYLCHDCLDKESENRRKENMD